MSLETKKRVVIAVLAASFVWPLVHYGLVRRLDLNPWNWWGWAMYTRPAPRVRASAVSLDDGRDLNLAGLPPERARAVRAAYDAFSTARMELGELVSPAAFARALLSAYPDVGGVRIVVQKVEMDPATGMVEGHSEPGWTYEYRRADLFR
jgi:hypothetical protein